MQNLPYNTLNDGNAIVVESQYNQPVMYNEPPVMYENQGYQQGYSQPIPTYHTGRDEGKISKYLYYIGFFTYIGFLLNIFMCKKSQNDQVQQYRNKSKRWAKLYSIALIIIIIIIILAVSISAIATSVENHDIDDVIF